MFVCMQCFCSFLIYKCESDTEFIWKHSWACVPGCTYVLISECFKSYPVPVELFIISICVCVSVYTLACVWCVWMYHQRSHQSLTFFLISNIWTLGREKHCFPPFKQQSLIPVAWGVSETLVLVYIDMYSLCSHSKHRVSQDYLLTLAYVPG